MCHTSIVAHSSAPSSFPVCVHRKTHLPTHHNNRHHSTSINHSFDRAWEEKVVHQPKHQHFLLCDNTVTKQQGCNRSHKRQLSPEIHHKNDESFRSLPSSNSPNHHPRQRRGENELSKPIHSIHPHSNPSKLTTHNWKKNTAVNHRRHPGYALDDNHNNNTDTPPHSSSTTHAQYTAKPQPPLSWREQQQQWQQQ